MLECEAQVRWIDRHVARSNDEKSKNEKKRRFKRLL